MKTRNYKLCVIIVQNGSNKIKIWCHRINLKIYEPKTSPLINKLNALVA